MSSDPPKSSEPAAEVVVRARGLGKCYHVYDRPKDRLKQFLFGRGKRYYREFWAARGIDLDIRRGETVGIVGKNGAGKTTLLQLIAGTLLPSEGELEVRGRVTALLELGSGFNRDFTGRENVFLSGAILGAGRSEIERRFADIAAFADIGEFMERPVRTYSRGMFVRLAFAVLANLDPDVFIVDEALAVGDAYFRHRCMLRFHEMQARGVTVLYVSHDAGSMKRLCDRVLWIDRGRAVELGSPDVVVDRYLLDLFGEKERARAKVDAGRGAASAPASRTLEPQRLEREIPNADRRTGDGRMHIVGVNLYDEEAREARSVATGSRILVRLTVANVDVDTSTQAWLVGYVLRNRTGEELVSTNSLQEGVELGELPSGAEVGITIAIRLPSLRQGSYSISPTVGYAPDPGTERVADWIDNALVFEITSTRRIRSQLALQSEFAVESAPVQAARA